MTPELAAYLKLQAAVSAALNFFVMGMVSGLIYHKADFVPTDPVSLGVDLGLTCLSAFMISMPLTRAGLRRDKTGDVLEATSPQSRFLARLFRRPLLFCLLFGFGTAALVFALAAPLFALAGAFALPFYAYVALKSTFGAALGAFVSTVLFYGGMCRVQ
ncbi:MAG TPA: hypothetical protein VN369_04080 [Terriglobales bacterium]|nr:hypothetical protein [Terriglobales bacterium]